MSYIDNYIQSKGGFNFDFINRNMVLTDKMHMKQPPFTKTGTTIVGLICKDAVILAADTRATAGPMVADKNCEKLHKLAPNIFAAGAGTAAGFIFNFFLIIDSDLQFVTHRLHAELELFRLNAGREIRINQVVTRLCDHLYRYQGYISTALIIGGFDCKGPQLASVSPYGNFMYTPFYSMGSGSLSALGILEAKYQDNLSLNDAITLAAEAIEGGIFHDLGSGSNVDICVIKKDSVDLKRNFRVYNKRTYEKKIPYNFPRNNTPYLKQYVYTIEKQEMKQIENEDDQMEVIE